MSEPDETAFEHEARLFDEACTLDGAERDAFLERELGDDPEALARMRRLLATDAEAQLPVDGMAAVPETVVEGLATGAALPGLPDSVGPFRILRLLGSGGMGVVYEAEQQQPRRSVALKVLRGGWLDESVLRRFEHEAQVLGWLQHPGIAQVYEAGTAETDAGVQPYFAMELVRGENLLEFAERNALDAPSRLRLLARVCDAIHHAHQKGVIHRDLKPGNVLVDETGQPKVLDFGIARVTGTGFEARTLETQVGELLGTLPFMSPEQVTGDPSKVDTRADVYALGVIGYQLLAGVLPLDVTGASVAEAVRAISEDEPTTLGARSRELRGDVETIVARAIEKDKERRYASAEELASDIRRHLANEPIIARPPSTLYQLAKFARRNRVLVAGIVGVVASLSAGLIVSSALFLESEARGERLEGALYDANQARAEAHDALQEANEARVEVMRALADAYEARADAEQALDDLRATEEYFDGFFQAASPLESGNDVRVVDVLERLTADIDSAFPDRPLQRARLHHRLASTYSRIGLPLAAFENAEQATALYEKYGPADAATQLNLLTTRDTVLRRLNRFEEAIETSHAFLALLDEVDPGPSLRRASCHIDLGASHTGLSRFDEGREQLAIGRAMLDELGNPSIDELARCIGTLAGNTRLAGRFDESLQLSYELVALHEEHDMPPFHMSAALQRLAEGLFARQRYAEALPLLERSTELLEGLVGERHHSVFERKVTRLVVLAQWHRDGRHADEWDELLPLAEELYGAPSANLASILGHKGMDLFFGGRLAEAEGYLRDAAGMLREDGQAPLDLSSNLANLATVLERLNQLEEAYDLIREAIEIREALTEPTHFRLGWDYNRLGSILAKLGDAEGAAAARAKAREIAAANSGG